MSFLRSGSAGVLALYLLALAPEVRAQDVTAPVLVDISVAPTGIDVTAGPAMGTVTAHLTDDLSGVASAAVLFVDPGFGTLALAYMDASSRTSGTANDGTYMTTFEIPEFSPAGSWTVFSLTLIDVADNSVSVPWSSLPPGFGFDVVSLEDTGPPTLAALSALPSAVDVTLGPGIIDVTAVLEDDRSGVDHASVTFESPSGTESVIAAVDASDRIAGDALSGTYAVQLGIPQLAETGIWTVSEVRIVDSYGYVRQLDAASLGIPSPPTIDVSASPDSVAPQLVWLALDPAVVYLGAMPPRLELTVRITDDVTGLGASGILLESPVEGIVAAVSLGAEDRISGTALDGIYIETVIFDPDAPLGAWSLTASVADAAGNNVQYSGGSIPGPAQIYVVAGPPPPPVPLLGPLGRSGLTLLLLALGAIPALHGRVRPTSLGRAGGQ